MNKLKNKEVWGYACGDFAQNMIFMMVSVYLLYFYTDVLKLAAGATSLLFLLMRIFDAINDPMMGFIADKTHTKWGKFRPYILFGAIPLAIVSILLFYTPPFGETGRLVWAYITYLLYGVIFTIVLVPYFAMPAAMTQNPAERSKISTVRVIMSTLAAFLVSALVKPILGLFPSEQTGFPFVTAGCGLIAVFGFYICFKTTTERVTQQSEETYHLKDIFRILKKNTPLILVSAGYVFYSIMYTMRMSVVAFYTKYYMKKESMTTIVLLLAIVGVLIGTSAALPMMNKFGKRVTYLIGAFIGAIGCGAMYFISAENILFIFILTTVGQIGAAIPLVVTWSMAPDTVDYSEWKTGIRAEGTTLGAFSFVQKFASAIAGSLSAAILASTGYAADVVQTQKALKGIVNMMTVIPAICCIFCMICIFFYPLNVKKMSEIVTDLQKKQDIVENK